MKEQLEIALSQGSIGLSTGLFYEPANAAPTAEVVELAKILEAYGGIYATHMRDEADFVVESVEEAIRIGSEAKVPIIISHHKCQGQHNHGKSVATLKAMAKARKTQSIALDVYPYAASSTGLNEVSVLRAQKTIVTWSDPYPELSGRDLESIAAEFGVSKLDAMQKLLPGGAIYFMMDESDIERIMTSSNAMIGSDGLPEDSHPHPRLWGTFPRVLGHYARDRQVMPMHDAINRMTGLSAENFNLAGRGMIKTGFFADVTIFNHETIIDLATFDKPKQKSLGVEQVIVNGKTAWIDGKCVGAGQGKVLKRRLSER
jgi:N-acyl-D-amino-acid deacylase